MKSDCVNLLSDHRFWKVNLLLLAFFKSFRSLLCLLTNFWSASTGFARTVTSNTLRKSLGDSSSSLSYSFWFKGENLFSLTSSKNSKTGVRTLDLSFYFFGLPDLFASAILKDWSRWFRVIWGKAVKGVCLLRDVFELVHDLQSWVNFIDFFWILLWSMYRLLFCFSLFSEDFEGMLWKLSRLPASQVTSCFFLSP